MFLFCDCVIGVSQVWDTRTAGEVVEAIDGGGSCRANKVERRQGCRD